MLRSESIQLWYQRKVSFTLKFLFPAGFYKAEKINYPRISFIRTTVSAGGTSKLNLLKPKPTNIAMLSTLGERKDIIEQDSAQGDCLVSL